jgi:hypothetical protein
VRWGCLNFVVNALEHSRKIIDYVVIPEADHPIAVRRQFSGPRRVRDLFVSVLTAVEFNDEFLCRAGKIGNALSDRMLAAEFQRWKAFT